MAVRSKGATVSGCLFFANVATVWGGAIFVGDEPTSASVSHCSFVGNIASVGPALMSLGGATSLDNCILCGNDGTTGPVVCDNHVVVLSCTDVYGNPRGDFVECIEGQSGVSGNISQDPLFCDPSGGDYHIRADSPCSPEHSGGCGLIGALPVGCPASPVSAATWGSIKATFRATDSSEGGR